MENNIEEKDKQLDDLIDLIVDNKKHFNSQKGYSRFKTRIQSEGMNSDRKLRRWIHAVAVFIPFIFLSYYTYQYFTLPATEEPISFFSEVVVPNGSKTQLILQDGTKVWVNSGSSIQCNTDFGKDCREIKLIGEAYLEVAPMENCPFVVSSGEVKIKVLGTKFNVNAYKENDEIKVALSEGAIEMTTDTNTPFLLLSKDVASYNITTRETKIWHNATKNMISWIDNKLLFEGETFEQIILTLERSFNVKVNIHKTSVKERCFVGDFVNNETIEQIFNVMSSDGKFKYKIKGNIIDVY